MPPVKKPIHKRSRTFLREWRQLRKLTQEEAADRIDIDRTTLGRIEKGEIPYNQDFLERLAQAYGCDVSDLIEINPLHRDSLDDIISMLKKASPDDRKKAKTILEAFLKAS